MAIGNQGKGCWILFVILGVKKSRESQKNGSGYISVESLILFPTSIENFCGLISGYHFRGKGQGMCRWLAEIMIAHRAKVAKK
jgi:hypothetical protein